MNNISFTINEYEEQIASDWNNSYADPAQLDQITHLIIFPKTTHTPKTYEAKHAPELDLIRFEVGSVGDGEEIVNITTNPDTGVKYVHVKFEATQTTHRYTVYHEEGNEYWQRPGKGSKYWDKFHAVDYYKPEPEPPTPPPPTFTVNTVYAFERPHFPGNGTTFLKCVKRSASSVWVQEINVYGAVEKHAVRRKIHTEKIFINETPSEHIFFSKEDKEHLNPCRAQNIHKI